MAARPPAKRLTGLNPLSYLGVEPLSPANFIIQLRNPGITDNQNYNIGDIWLNAVTEDPWMLVNLDQGDATWIPFGMGSAGGLLSLTGNTGGPVFGDGADNVNILGDIASNLTFTGNPGTNTLTLFTTGGGSVGLSLTGDAPSTPAVFDAAGNIDILGGPNINTSSPGGGSELEVALNQVIRWTNSNAAGTQGYIYLNGSNGSGGERFMHNAGADETNTFLGIRAGNPMNTGTDNVGIGADTCLSTSGLRNTAVGSGSLNALTTTDDNTAVGALALTSCIDGFRNTALGAGSLANMTTSSNNVAVGFQSMFNATIPTFNVCIGALAGLNGTTFTRHVVIGADSAQNMTTNRGCVVLGHSAGNSITTGDFNIAIGSNALTGGALTGTGIIAIGTSAGANYTTTDNSNIIIGEDLGVGGESNTIRFGVQGGGVGQQNRNFMAGINGVTVASPATVVIDTVTNQLGIGAGGTGAAGENLFLATWNGNVSYIDATGITQTYQLGTASPAGVGAAALIELADPDNVFFPGDGLVGGTPASFTAPFNGTYLMVWNFYNIANSATQTFVNTVATSLTYRKLSISATALCFYDVFEMTAGDTVTWEISNIFSAGLNFRIVGQDAMNRVFSNITGYRLN